MKNDEIMIKRKDATTLKHYQVLGWKYIEGKRGNTGEETEDTVLSSSSHKTRQDEIVAENKEIKSTDFGES